MLLKAALILAAIVSGGAAHQPALPGGVGQAPNFQNNPYLPCLAPVKQTDCYSNYPTQCSGYIRVQEELAEQLKEQKRLVKRHQKAVLDIQAAQKGFEDFAQLGLVPCSSAKKAKK